MIRRIDDAQLTYDAEAAVDFSKRTGDYYLELQACEKKQAECAEALKKAREATEAARGKLQGSIHAFVTGSPLFEWAQRNGNGAAEPDALLPENPTFHGIEDVPDVSVEKLQLGKKLAAALSLAGFDTASKLVRLAWQHEEPLNKALLRCLKGDISPEDALKVRDKLFGYLVIHAPKPIAGERCCRACNCTEAYCPQCVVRRGVQCQWVSDDLCSACNK